MANIVMPWQVRLTVVPLHRGDLRITGICYSISNVVRGRIEFKVCCGIGCINADRMVLSITAIPIVFRTAPGQASPCDQTAAVARHVCRRQPAESTCDRAKAAPAHSFGAFAFKHAIRRGMQRPVKRVCGNTRPQRTAVAGPGMQIQETMLELTNTGTCELRSLCCMATHPYNICIGLSRAVVVDGQGKVESAMRRVPVC